MRAKFLRRSDEPPVSVILPYKEGDPVNNIYLCENDELIVVTGEGIGYARIVGALCAKNDQTEESCDAHREEGSKLIRLTCRQPMIIYHGDRHSICEIPANIVAGKVIREQELKAPHHKLVPSHNESMLVSKQSERRRVLKYPSYSLCGKY